MMLKEKSNPWARVKYLYVLPLAALAVSAFARPEVSAVADELSSAKVNDLVASMKTNQAETAFVAAKDSLTPDEPVFEVVEQMPEFPGGYQALMNYLTKNIQYPDAAVKADKQGRVVVRFVVRANGNVTDVSVISGVDPLLDAEAVRVVKAMPKWKPGMQDGKYVAVEYTLPVMFRTMGKSKAKDQTLIIKGTSAADYADVLILVDGREITPEILQALNPGRIQSFNILKEPSEMAKYTTDKSKKAVMLVTLKKGEPKVQADAVPGIRVSDSARKAQVVIDGKVVDEAAFKSLSAEQIESINVLKPEVATALFGEEGKDGILYIFTKSAAGVKDGEVKVRGLVLDSKDEPVIGASILIEGTDKGTVTDPDGMFSLPAPGDATLKVSYIGMKEARMKVQPIALVRLEAE